MIAEPDAEVLARTLESIHGDLEMLIKRARSEGISKSSAINVCSDAHKKIDSVRHVIKRNIVFYYGGKPTTKQPEE
jgi:hypothetical protein